jgi:hypothetical protein
MAVPSQLLAKSKILKEKKNNNDLKQKGLEVGISGKGLV